MRVFCLLFATAIASNALAQHVIWEQEGPVFGTDTGFPGRFDAGEDVNGDGVGDVVAGSPPFGVGSEFKGKVFVYSGVDGSLIHEVVGGWEQAAIGGTTLLTGDLDGDGLSEFSTASYLGYTFVYSGADASVLHRLVPAETWWFQRWEPKATLHVDGDGVPDLVLGCWSCEPDVTGYALYGAGAVAAVSGADGSVFWTYPGGAGLDRLGWSAANVGDVDGDGVDDLLVGAPGFGGFDDEVYYKHDSFALLLSGADGHRLARIDHDPLWQPEYVNFRFGWTVDAGDLDLDGVPELLVSDGWHLEAASVYSGVDGALLHQTEGGDGQVVRSVGDVDGDGFADYLGCYYKNLDEAGCYGPSGHGCGTCTVYSGEDHAEILIVRRGDSKFFGSYAAAAGDVDGDGFPDVAISEDFWLPAGGTDFLGRLSMMSLIPKGVKTLGEGCAGYQGLVPRIGVRGSPMLGDELTVFVSQAAPGVPAVLGLGTAELLPPLDLTSLGLPGCLQHVDVTAVFTSTTKADPPVPGRAAVGPFLMPDDASLLGTSVFAQWWVDGSGGFPASVTRALRFDPFAPHELPGEPTAEAGARRLVLAGISPASVQAFGATPVTLTGSGFLGVTELHVGGTTLVPPFEVSVVDDGTLTFQAPQPAALGTVEITVASAAGESNALELTYLATAPPNLVGTGLALTGQTLFWNFGSLPDHAWFLLAQVDDPTTIPFGGFEVLGAPPAMLSTGTLNAAGIGSATFLVPPGLAGSSVHSQLVVLDGALAFVAASNVQVATILF